MTATATPYIQRHLSQASQRNIIVLISPNYLSAYQSVEMIIDNGLFNIINNVSINIKRNFYRPRINQYVRGYIPRHAYFHIRIST